MDFVNNNTNTSSVQNLEGTNEEPSSSGDSIDQQCDETSRVRDQSLHVNIDANDDNTLNHFASLSDDDSHGITPAQLISSSGSSTNEQSLSESDDDGGSNYGDNDKEYIAGTFEGPEKTMEIIFRNGVGISNGLRSLKRKQLDRICAAAKCTIMSKISNNHVDAYVLSESSLFVYSHRLVMKTCGTTTLLRCIGTILSYTDDLGMELTWLGYSRKNLFFPKQQEWPHSSFGDEMKYIDSHEKLQNRLQGVGHILGPITGDHWFVYVADLEDITTHVAGGNSRNPSPTASTILSNDIHHPIRAVSNGALPPPSLIISSAGTTDPYVGDDRTINMMMFDMAPGVASQFYLANTPGGGKEMTQKSGIAALCPGAKIDETSFAPCGYSMNAILHDAYYTIHVTPEPECSYVSFETNASLRSYSALVRNVLRVFKPRRFLLTLFGDDKALKALSTGELPTDPKVVDTGGHGVYNRISLASSSMANGEEMAYLANYSLDLSTLPKGIFDDGVELVPATVPPAEFPHGFRQRPRGQSLGDAIPSRKYY